MGNTVKGILIDVHERTVKEAKVQKNDIHDIHRLVGCDCFTCVSWGGSRNETVYVDDEGLLKNPKKFFKVPGYPQWIAGNGLIIGTNECGDSVDTSLTVTQVEQLVHFGEIKDSDS